MGRCGSSLGLSRHESIYIVVSSCPALCRASTSFFLARVAPDIDAVVRGYTKTWMPATSAGMAQGGDWTCPGCALALGGSPTRRGRFPGLGELRCSAGAFAGADALRGADDGDEETVCEQPFGHALGVRERHRIDETGAALNIVDAEIVELHLQELARNPVRGIEPERKGPLEIALGLDEFGFGRAVLGEPVDLALDELDGFARRVGPRCGMAEQQRGAIEPEEAVGDAVSEAALLPDLDIKPRGERAAAENVIDDIGGHEIGIAAGYSRPAEIHYRLRHIEMDDDPAAQLLRDDRRDRLELGLGRQRAEGAVDKLSGGRRLHVAHGGDLWIVARERAPGGGSQVVDGDLGHGFERAVHRLAVGMVGEGRCPPVAARHVVGAEYLAPQPRDDLRAHALDRRSVEARLGERERPLVEGFVAGFGGGGEA